MNDEEILKKKSKSVLLSPYEIDMVIHHEDKENLSHKDAWVHKDDVLFLMREAREDEREKEKPKGGMIKCRKKKIQERAAR